MSETQPQAPEILFVCTGNTCRSPLAEAIARQRLRELGLPYRVASAGVAAHDGAPASEPAVQVAREAGLDLESHAARLLTRRMVLEATQVFALGESQRAFIDVLAPEARERVHLLREYATHGAERGEVQDPIGGSVQLYRRTLEEIRRLVDASLQRLIQESASRKS